MPLNKDAFHEAYVCPTALLLYPTYNCHITACQVKDEQQTANFIYHAKAIYVPTTNILLKCNMSYMQISSYVGMKKLCQYISVLPKHYNQQSDQVHWYTYTSYCWHNPLNKYPCHIA